MIERIEVCVSLDYADPSRKLLGWRDIKTGEANLHQYLTAGLAAIYPHAPVVVALLRKSKPDIEATCVLSFEESALNTEEYSFLPKINYAIQTIVGAWMASLNHAQDDPPELAGPSS